MVNRERRRFLVGSAAVLVSAGLYALIGSTGVLAKKGKDELHDLDEDEGGRGTDIDDRRLSDEGGHGQGSDDSGQRGRPKNGDAIDIARKELEAEKDDRLRRFSDPLHPDRERF